MNCGLRIADCGFATPAVSAIIGGGGLVGTIVSILIAVRPLSPITLPEADKSPAARSDSAAPPASDSGAARLVARDPFRIARGPATVAYDPLRLAEQQAPLPPRPVLTLVGVVDGKDPTAVVQGLPGVDGLRVLRVGDVVAGIKLRKIASESVWLVGFDTTWVLRIKEAR